MRAEASIERFFDRLIDQSNVRFRSHTEELKSGFASAGVAAGATNRKKR